MSYNFGKRYIYKPDKIESHRSKGIIVQLEMLSMVKTIIIGRT